MLCFHQKAFKIYFTWMNVRNSFPHCCAIWRTFKAASSSVSNNPKYSLRPLPGLVNRAVHFRAFFWKDTPVYLEEWGRSFVCTFGETLELLDDKDRLCLVLFLRFILFFFGETLELLNGDNSLRLAHFFRLIRFFSISMGIGSMNIVPQFVSYNSGIKISKDISCNDILFSRSFLPTTLVFRCWQFFRVECRTTSGFNLGRKGF